MDKPKKEESSLLGYVYGLIESIFQVPISRVSDTIKKIGTQGKGIIEDKDVSSKVANLFAVLGTTLTALYNAAEALKGELYAFIYDTPLEELTSQVSQYGAAPLGDTKAAPTAKFPVTTTGNEYGLQMGSYAAIYQKNQVNNQYAAQLLMDKNKNIIRPRLFDRAKDWWAQESERKYWVEAEKLYEESKEWQMSGKGR